MGVLPLAIRAFSHFFDALHTHSQLQGEKLISDDGGELTRHPTMAGRIFAIVTTKSRHNHVIVEAFSVSGSRDKRYGMPTMYTSPEHGHHTILPSVSNTLLWRHLF